MSSEKLWKIQNNLVQASVKKNSGKPGKTLENRASFGKLSGNLWKIAMFSRVFY